MRRVEQGFKPCSRTLLHSAQLNQLKTQKSAKSASEVEQSKVLNYTRIWPIVSRDKNRRFKNVDNTSVENQCSKPSFYTAVKRSLWDRATDNNKQMSYPIDRVQKSHLRLVSLAWKLLSYYLTDPIICNLIKQYPL